jgi:hypothetical protein
MLKYNTDTRLRSETLKMFEVMIFCNELYASDALLVHLYPYLAMTGWKIDPNNTNPT